MKIDLTRQVQDSNGEVYEITHINLKGAVSTISVPYINFIEKYENYVDPKDAEIARLKAIIDELKNPQKQKVRRKRLLPEEWKEVQELIRKGVSNTDIANEYKISDSSVSKKRIEMRKFGENV